MRAIPCPGKPHTEIEIVNCGGYVFIGQNQHTAQSRMAVQSHLAAEFPFPHGNPPPCNCEPIGGLRCNDSRCINYASNVSCVDCGILCCNQNTSDSTAVTRSMVYVGKYEDQRGFGLFANELITPGMTICRFNGNWKFSHKVKAKHYSFDLGVKGFLLSAEEEGSSARLINHSCFPNTFTRVIDHRGDLQVLYVSERIIQKDEEITVKYNCVYNGYHNALKCLCGAPHCTGWIGTYKPLTNSRHPNFLPPKVPNANIINPTEVAAVISDSLSQDPSNPAQQTAKQGPSTLPLHDEERDNKKETLSKNTKIVNRIVLARSNKIEVGTWKEDFSEQSFKGKRGTYKPYEELQDITLLHVLGLLQLAIRRRLEGIPRWPLTFERHEFDTGDEAYCYAYFTMRLAYVRCIVMQTFKNRHGVDVVRVYIPRYSKECYLPKCFVFGNAELAALNLKSFARQKAELLKKFFKEGYALRPHALKGYVLSDYMKQWCDGTLPRVRLIHAPFSAPKGVGHPNYTLEVTDVSRDAEQTTDIPDDDSSLNNSPLKPDFECGMRQTNAKTFTDIPLNVSQSQVKNLKPGTEVEVITKRNSGSNKPTPPGSSKAYRGFTITGDFNLKMQPDYNPTERMEFGECLTDVWIPTLLMRIFNKRVGQATWYSNSRTKGKYVGDDEREKIRNWMYNHYFCPIDALRKFVNIEDYKVACEEKVPGSVSIYWCSLCKVEYAFNNKDTFRRHFFNNHCFACLAYPCRKCHIVFQLPSAFIKHLETCDPDMHAIIQLDTPVKWLDCVTDVSAMKDEASNRLYVYTPGLPNLRREKSIKKKNQEIQEAADSTGTSSPNTSSESLPNRGSGSSTNTQTSTYDVKQVDSRFYIQRSPRHKLEPKIYKGKPLDPSIAKHPYDWRIAKTYNVMSDFSQLTLSFNERACPSACEGEVFPHNVFIDPENILEQRSQNTPESFSQTTGKTSQDTQFDQNDDNVSAGINPSKKSNAALKFLQPRQAFSKDTTNKKTQPEAVHTQSTSPLTKQVSKTKDKATNITKQSVKQLNIPPVDFAKALDKAAAEIAKFGSKGKRVAKGITKPSPTEPNDEGRITRSKSRLLASAKPEGTTVAEPVKASGKRKTTDRKSSSPDESEVMNPARKSRRNT